MSPYLYAFLVWFAALLVHLYALKAVSWGILLWTSLYTLGLPSETRKRRMAEIESDLAEAKVAGKEGGLRPEAVAFEQLVRWCLGVPGELSFRFAETGNSPSPLFIGATASLTGSLFLAELLGYPLAENFLAIVAVYGLVPLLIPFGLLLSRQSPTSYRILRNAILISGTTCLICYLLWVWPAAPPRLPGFDGLELGLDASDLVLPSLVTASGVWLAVAFGIAFRKTWIRFLCPLIPLVILMAMAFSAPHGVVNGLVGLAIGGFSSYTAWKYETRSRHASARDLISS